MLRSEFESLTGIYPPENLFEVIEEFYMKSKLSKQDFCYHYRFNVNAIAEKIQNEANSHAAHIAYQFGMMLGETKRELLLANQEIEQLRIRLVAISKERG